MDGQNTTPVGSGVIGVHGAAGQQHLSPEVIQSKSTHERTGVTTISIAPSAVGTSPSKEPATAINIRYPVLTGSLAGSQRPIPPVILIPIRTLLQNDGQNL